jgi:hypothetical protein
MKVLSKQELNKLMKVRTTLEQAEQIIERNTKALDALRKKKFEVIDLGCPHCIKDCNNCAYPYKKKTDFGEQCLDYKFGGIAYNDINELISLSPYSLTVHEGNFHQDSDPLLAELRCKTERWLLGHIEWAEAVIKACTIVVHTGKSSRT